MREDRQPYAPITRLPKELVDRLTRPFARFLRVEAAGGAILLLFTVAALVLSNSPWAEPFLAAWETPVGLRIGALEFARSVQDWINDGLMTPARRWVNDERLYAMLDEVVAHPAGDHGSGDTKDRATLQVAEIDAREALSGFCRSVVTRLAGSLARQQGVFRSERPVTNRAARGSSMAPATP